MNNVNKSLRIVNFAIDLLVITIVASLVCAIFDFGFNCDGIGVMVMFLYYLLSEYFAGRTLGKLITRTRVVCAINAKPGFLRVLLRTILRFNPFDGLSYLFGHELGGHDILSKTKLIDDE